MTDSSPKTFTTYGRLSFPAWTAQEAYALSLRGSYPVADVASATPSFSLLLDDAQWQRLATHMKSVFLPYCAAQFKKGEKKDALDSKEVQALIDGLNGDLGDQTFNTPVKAVHEKSAELAPETVASLKVMGKKGVDFTLMAIVNKEEELAVPDPDLLSYPVVKPLGMTVHKMYAGCYVAATLNFYAYHNGKHPGFSASASTAVFRRDGDRFGGGVDVDEDAIFMD
jgi:hypothetical protein